MSKDLTGKIGTVVGWGRDERGNTVSNELKEVQIKAIDNEVCIKDDDRYAGLVTDKTYCAGKQS